MILTGEFETSTISIRKEALPVLLPLMESGLTIHFCEVSKQKVNYKIKISGFYNTYSIVNFCDRVNRSIKRNCDIKNQMKANITNTKPNKKEEKRTLNMTLEEFIANNSKFCYKQYEAGEEYELKIRVNDKVLISNMIPKIGMGRKKKLELIKEDLKYSSF